MKAQESWLSTEQHFQGHNEVQSWVTWSVDEVSRLGMKDDKIKDFWRGFIAGRRFTPGWFLEEGGHFA